MFPFFPSSGNSVNSTSLHLNPQIINNGIEIIANITVVQKNPFPFAVSDLLKNKIIGIATAASIVWSTLLATFATEIIFIFSLESVDNLFTIPLIATPTAVYAIPARIYETPQSTAFMVPSTGHTVNVKISKIARNGGAMII